MQSSNADAGPILTSSSTSDAQVETRSTPASDEARRGRVRGRSDTWQQRLLPLMSGMLVTLTGFFFIASFVQLYYLQSRIENAPQLDLAPAFHEAETVLNKGAPQDKAAFDTRFEYARWKVLALLEGVALQRRYHQAGILLISRVWTRYLGFVTGTMMALVGAAFILGKLREGSSSLSSESPAWKVSITTASPGLILAVLGTLLMLATQATSLDMQVGDGVVYLRQPSAVQSNVPPPPLVPDATEKPRPDTKILSDMKAAGEKGK